MAVYTNLVSAIVSGRPSARSGTLVTAHSVNLPREDAALRIIVENLT